MGRLNAINRGTPMSEFIDQTAAFERACKTMDNIRKAAEAGDKEAQLLLKMSEENNPGFILADLRKWRPTSTK